jgi:uncharacterized membrane protein
MDQTKDKPARIVVVDIIKAAACLVIFLAHCNTIMPGNWDWLIAFGQDFGNNLFFMVSGFALAPSIDSTPVKRAHIWYVKRLIRILPITMIAYAVMYSMGYFSFKDPSQLFVVFVYPTLYWFVSAILIFYIILFFIAKYAGKKTLVIINIVLFILYILSGQNKERLYLMGLISMIVGYMLRKYIQSEGWRSADSVETSRKKRFFLAGLIISCGVYVAGELSGVRYVSAALAFAGALFAGCFLMLLGVLSNDGLLAFFENRKRLHSFIRYVGDMALPLYIVQCLCAGYIGYTIGQRVDFPLSFLVNFIIVWSAGTVLYFISAVTGRRIAGRL